MDALRNSKKNLTPSCSHSFFIHTFHFDFGCTSYVREGDEVYLGSCLADQCLDTLSVTRLRYGTYTVFEAQSRVK